MQSITRYQRESFVECVKMGVFTIPVKLATPSPLVSAKYVLFGMYGLICYPIIFLAKLTVEWAVRIRAVHKIRQYKTCGQFDYFKMRRVGKERYEKEHAQEIADRKEQSERMWAGILEKINNAT